MDQVVQDVDFELGGFLHTHASFVSRVVGVNPGQRAVIVNGEVMLVAVPFTVPFSLAGTFCSC